MVIGLTLVDLASGHISYTIMNHFYMDPSSPSQATVLFQTTNGGVMASPASHCPLHIDVYYGMLCILYTNDTWHLYAQENRSLAH
jgi:hypothetical protein